jgi:hypothetical protein
VLLSTVLSERDGGGSVVGWCCQLCRAVQRGEGSGAVSRGEREGRRERGRRRVMGGCCCCCIVLCQCLRFYTVGEHCSYFVEYFLKKYIKKIIFYF